MLGKPWTTSVLGWRHIEKISKSFFVVSSNKFSLFVIFMLCLLVKTFLKTCVRRVLNHPISWVRSYRKKSRPKFSFIFFNNFSLIVTSMLCLLVNTIVFESKCSQSSEPRPFLDDAISKKIGKVFYFVFFNNFSRFVISMLCLLVKTILFL